MSILGINSERTKDDNLFQRLFWPTNQPGEMDTLGQQGYWICLIVALLSGTILLLTGNPLLGLLTASFFWLGGVGVRQHSVVAAILVAIAYLLNIIVNVVAGLPPGVISIICAGLLFANIRGTIIASKWSRLGDPDTFPERMNATVFDQLVDQVPQRVWPAGKYVFYGVSFLYFALMVVGSISIVNRKAHTIPPDTQTIELQSSPSTR